MTSGASYTITSEYSYVTKAAHRHHGSVWPLEKGMLTARRNEQAGPQISFQWNYQIIYDMYLNADFF